MLFKEKKQQKKSFLAHFQKNEKLISTYIGFQVFFSYEQAMP